MLAAILSHATFAEEQQDYVDFSDQITPVCEVKGLKTPPPTGWINVPIDTGVPDLAGCQMMLIENEALIGVLRILSFDLNQAPDDAPPWPQYVMTYESVLIDAMGYKIIEPIWRRAEVPISGQGFGNGQAIGFKVKIEGNPNEQESHMLVFDSNTNKYLVNLLTPAKSVDDGSYYTKNLAGIKAVMQSFKVPKDQH